MNFNTVEFLVMFLPLVLAAYHVLPGRWRLAFILVASFVFYGFSGLVPLYFLILSVTWGFATAMLGGRMSKRAAIWIAVSGPLVVLFLFKYLNFTLTTAGAGKESFEAMSFFLSAALPAGVSFYTFQIISYSIDALDRDIPVERDYLKLAAYVSFFPQLIAGPIVRYEQIRPQLEHVIRTRWLSPDLRTGFKFLAFGLLGKIFIADILGMLHRNRFAVDFLAEGTQFDAIYLCLAYSFQIYYDFWAYSIMAIGLGKLFAIDLPINFREPYLSRNPRDFWRRWHITLSYWLRDYVYIKLGGNRHYVRNIVIVFATVGLWHGAGWSFVVWGLYHAVLVIVYHFTRPAWDRMPGILQIALTFILVSFGWPLFFADVGEYWNILLKIAGAFGNGPGVYGLHHWLYLGLVAAWTFFMREQVWLYNTDRRVILDWPVTHASALVIGLIFSSLSTTFIYFRF